MHRGHMAVSLECYVVEQLLKLLQPNRPLSLFELTIKDSARITFHELAIEECAREAQPLEVFREHLLPPKSKGPEHVHVQLVTTVFSPRWR